MKAKDYTQDLKKMRNNLRIVVEYLTKLNDKEPIKELNDDSVKLLLEVIKIQSTWYLDLELLTSKDVRLLLEKELLERTLNKREKDIVEALRLKL